MSKVNRKSILGTFHKYVDLIGKIRATNNLELYEEYFYILGKLQGIIDMDCISEDVNYYIPELWDEVQDLINEIEEY